jgi:carbohydrate-selective porin OprB
MPAKDQYGVETYWNVVLTPNWTFTPGISFIWNPAFNPTAHFGVIPSLKFRIFL